MASAGLRPIDISRLEIGAMLESDLFDAVGRTVVRGGQTLDRALLDRVRRICGYTVYVHPSFASQFTGGAGTSSPQEILDALEAQHGGTISHERREHERFTWCVPLELEIEESSGNCVTQRSLDVVTYDISRGGFAFLVRGYIHSGSLIRASFPSLEGSPRVDGIVRNCRYFGDNQHRVGVEFVEVLTQEPELAGAA